MRITIRIDDQLHAEAKKWASEQGTTLTTLIEKASARRSPAGTPPIATRSFG